MTRCWFRRPHSLSAVPGPGCYWRSPESRRNRPPVPAEGPAVVPTRPQPGRVVSYRSHTRPPERLAGHEGEIRRAAAARPYRGRLQSIPARQGWRRRLTSVGRPALRSAPTSVPPLSTRTVPAPRRRASSRSGTSRSTLVRPGSRSRQVAVGSRHLATSAGSPSSICRGRGPDGPLPGEFPAGVTVLGAHPQKVAAAAGIAPARGRAPNSARSSHNSPEAATSPSGP